MERQEAIKEIRSNWRRLYRADKKGSGITCPICGSGSGSHGTGITADTTHGRPESLRCWSCGFSGDVLDLIQQETGRDFIAAVQYAADQLGIVIDRQPGSARPAAARKQSAPTITTEPEPAPALEDYTGYYVERAKALQESQNGLSYLQARGISINTARRFLLGYDPAWISPAAVRKLKADGNSWRPPATERIIIPVSENHYVARATDPAVTEYKKPNETGGGRASSFNLAALQKEKPVFLVEGAFDALSIAEAGENAIALNSANRARAFLEEAKDIAAPVIILCMDNDRSGQEALSILKAGLDEMGVLYTQADISGEYKDPNEALVKEREVFMQKVKDAAEQATQKAEAAKCPGLLTYEAAVDIFQTAQDEYIEIKRFPDFSKTAKIKVHDSVVIAADTGAGKSSLAINFLDGLNDTYPVLYINLEMDSLTILQRLVSIRTGIELDQIEGYKKDANTAKNVNNALQEITARKPLQILQDTYSLEAIEQTIRNTTKDREDPTIVFIDHSLLVTTSTQKNSSRYERFTYISEELRRIARQQNIILFILLQQSREGKKDKKERPDNYSLKESGSWENDATHIIFLWQKQTDLKDAKRLSITKNRGGRDGEFMLAYYAHTQTYREKKKVSEEEPVRVVRSRYYT